jgi:hypothetical protein
MPETTSSSGSRPRALLSRAISSDARVNLRETATRCRGRQAPSEAAHEDVPRQLPPRAGRPMRRPTSSSWGRGNSVPTPCNIAAGPTRDLIACARLLDTLSTQRSSRLGRPCCCRHRPRRRRGRPRISMISTSRVRSRLHWSWPAPRFSALPTTASAPGLWGRSEFALWSRLWPR